MAAWIAPSRRVRSSPSAAEIVVTASTTYAGAGAATARRARPTPTMRDTRRDPELGRSPCRILRFQRVPHAPRAGSSRISDRPTVQAAGRPGRFDVTRRCESVREERGQRDELPAGVALYDRLYHRIQTVCRTIRCLTGGPRRLAAARPRSGSSAASRAYTE